MTNGCSKHITPLLIDQDKKSSHEPTVEESPGIDFTSTYFKIGFWDGLSPKVGGGLFFCERVRGRET